MEGMDRSEPNRAFRQSEKIFAQYLAMGAALIPTPIDKSFLRSGEWRPALLMGGQACVFYGAAQVSKDIDLVLLEEAGQFSKTAESFGGFERQKNCSPAV